LAVITTPEKSIIEFLLCCLLLAATHSPLPLPISIHPMHGILGGGGGGNGGARLSTKSS